MLQTQKSGICLSVWLFVYFTHTFWLANICIFNSTVFFLYSKYFNFYLLICRVFYQFRPCHALKTVESMFKWSRGVKPLRTYVIPRDLSWEFSGENSFPFSVMHAVVAFAADTGKTSWWADRHSFGLAKPTLVVIYCRRIFCWKFLFPILTFTPPRSSNGQTHLPCIEKFTIAEILTQCLPCVCSVYVGCTVQFWYRSFILFTILPLPPRRSSVLATWAVMTGDFPRVQTNLWRGRSRIVEKRVS